MKHVRIGNMTVDRNKSIRGVTYNTLNLPETIRVRSAMVTVRYDALGRKLYTHYNPSYSLFPMSRASALPHPGGPGGEWSGTLGEGTDYCGPFVFRQGVLERAVHAQGYFDAGGACHYYLRDRMGNNRAVAGADSIGLRTAYYAYGLPHTEANSPDRYKYMGREIYPQNGLYLYDDGARWYDGGFGRFIQPDPKAHDYPGVSPYAYCMGDPINLVDPSGQIVELIGTEEEIATLQSLIDMMMGSGIFSDVYSALEGSDEIFTIGFGQCELTDEVTGEVSTCQGQKQGNRITLDITNYSIPSANYFTLGEETYHLYQSLNPEFFEDNNEFEAKTIALLELIEAGLPQYSGGDVKNWGNKILEDCTFNYDYYQYLDKDKLLFLYPFYGHSFVDYHKDNPAKDYHVPVFTYTNRFLNSLNHIKPLCEIKRIGFPYK